MKTGMHSKYLTRDEVFGVLEDFIETACKDARGNRITMYATEDVARAWGALTNKQGGTEKNTNNEKLSMPPPMKIECMQKNNSTIRAASVDFITFLGKHFSTPPKEHIEPDISAAASLAGLMVFRHNFPGLGSHNEKTIIIYPIDPDLENMRNFINGISGSFGLDLSCGVTSIPKANKHHYFAPEITSKIEMDFLTICRKHNLQQEYYPFVTFHTCLSMIAAGKKMGILEEKIGISLMIYYFIAGARTMPYPLKDCSSG